MRNIAVIFRREFVGYFTTPLAYVFIVIFLVMAGLLTFFVGNFFGRGQADLQPFFTFHPWLYLVLIPALSMRLWAEERTIGNDRAVPDLADPHRRGSHRQVPRRLVLCRDRAGPDLSVLADGQFSRPSR